MGALSARLVLRQRSWHTTATQHRLASAKHGPTRRDARLANAPSGTCRRPGQKGRVFVARQPSARSCKPGLWPISSTPNPPSQGGHEGARAVRTTGAIKGVLDAQLHSAVRPPWRPPHRSGRPGWPKSTAPVAVGSSLGARGRPPAERPCGPAAPAGGRGRPGSVSSQLDLAWRKKVQAFQFRSYQGPAGYVNDRPWSRITSISWVTVASAATAVRHARAGLATFSVVRSGRRAPRATEMALLAGIRPLRMPSNRKTPTRRSAS